MRTVKILGGGAVAVLLLLVGGWYAYMMLAYPRVGPAPDLTVEATPERLVRGRYLAEHVMGCFDCHSERRADRYSMPPAAGSDGAGGLRFGPELGVPGTVYTPNITPFGLGDWSDGEIYRAITTGVRRDGSVIFPIMPYAAYGQADPEDIFAVIAFLRSVPPIEKTQPAPEIDFPASLMIRTIPVNARPGERPRENDHPAYGRYLAMIGGCMECHTDFADGAFTGPPFAGGRTFSFPGVGTIRSANITPDPDTGIGGWSRQDFIDRFIANSRADYEEMAVAPGEANTVMPWWAFSGMRQLDLSALYDFLMTVEPVRNDVVRFTPPAPGR